MPVNTGLDSTNNRKLDYFLFYYRAEQNNFLECDYFSMIIK